MLTRFSIRLGWVTVAVLAFVPGLRAFERILREDFPVTPGCHLNVDTYRGSIIITTADVAQIRVEIHMQPGAEKRDEGDALMERLRMDLKSEQNNVSIFARNLAETRVRFVWEEKQKINMAYYILVPYTCVLNLQTADGGITVTDLKASVTARAFRGAVVLKHISGAIDASTDSASIVLSHCDSAVKLADRLGDIRVGAVEGFLDASNTSGDIEVQHAQGGAKLYTNSGDITVGFAPGLAKDTTVTTNGGAIYVRLDPLTHCTIKASSSPLGEVSTKVALHVTAGANKKSILEGDCAGGGPVIALHAHGGYVQIDPPRI